MSTDLEQHQGAALAVRADQSEWTPTQLAALAHMGIKDAPREDQQVFLHHCQRTGLDPFAKQVYMIGRSGDVKRIDDKGREITERGTIYTIQTGIDGYRLIGERAARRHGDTIEHLDPLWRGKPGSERDEWTDYWPEGAGAPAACKYVIVKNGQRIVATVNFHEYVQYSGRGELTAMWKKMPANQLAVRAEAQAWRKAYPADFSGVGLEGDPHHHTIIDAETGEFVGPAPTGRRPGPRSGAAALEQHLGKPEPQPAAPKPAKATKAKAAPADPAEPGTLTTSQREAILKGLDELFADARGRAEFVCAAVKRDVHSIDDLTNDEADELLLTIAEHTAATSGGDNTNDANFTG
jgi:hypothetical protein